jgi:predicted DCC family thiol-disulfide oxidoreductase YuxK
MVTGQNGLFGHPVVHLVAQGQNYVIGHVAILLLHMVDCHVLVMLRIMWIVPCQVFVQVYNYGNRNLSYSLFDKRNIDYPFYFR